LRSSASMASNIAPVTSLPWLGCPSKGEDVSGAIDHDALAAVGLEATVGFLWSWRARYTRNAGCQMARNCLYKMSEVTFFAFTERKKNRGDLPVDARLPSSVVGQRMAGRPDWNSREQAYPTPSLTGKCYAVDS